MSVRARLFFSLFASIVWAQNPPAVVNVDANASRHPISPNIYGFAFGSQTDLAVTNFTVNRSGGNLTSTYNWQINAGNHDNDWYFESILDYPQMPGYDGDTFITQTRAANVGAQPLLTIPMMSFIANLGAGGASLWSYSIAKYGAQTGSDPYQPDAGNGISAATGNAITGNNPLDAYTPNSVAIQQGWMQHLIGAWGNAAAGGLKYYIMDNEPSLWNSTHRDIHPACESYSELYNDYITYAAAVRAADANAIIVGPEEWSWWALYVSGCDQQTGPGAAGSDYNTHNQTYYYPWLLQQLNAYQQKTGQQLLNVASVHYYPQELSNSDDDSLSGQLVRNQSTRALWDPNYVDPSWFNQVGINGGIVNLIPTLKTWVSQYYPGLQTAITEYTWGDESHLNGATTQADVLGIFGQQGLDMATRWGVPLNPSPTYLALEIYRNYDGKLSTYGDTSVAASVVNPDNLSSFASVRTSDGALTVMVINKQQGATPVSINLANFSTGGTAQAYQISSATQAAIQALGSVAVSGNAITATLPSQSITLFVIPSGSVTSAPSAPTGLSATPGNGTVSLAWSPGAGSTSSTVKRASVSGGPYVTSGAVTTSSYTDSGLTNGTTYYYVVSASNTTGSSANSAEVSATPSAPTVPAFTSSATAPSTIVPGATAPISLTVTDSGTGSLSGGNVELQVFNSAGTAVMTQVWSAQNFSAGQKQVYSYTWSTPASLAAGSYTVDVGVFDSAWQNDYYWNTDATITVSAAAPKVSLSSSALTFSSQTVGTTSAAQFVTVANSGTGALTISGIAISGTDFAQTNNCGTALAVGAQCSISVTFTPSAAGNRSASIVLTDNAANSPQSITLSGTGAGVPAVSLSSSALTFASQTVGSTSAAQSVTLTNSGTGALTISGIALGGTNPTDFAETTTCGASLAVGAQCGISVTFKPTAAGSRSGSITLTDNAAGSPQSISLNGAATAAAGPPVFTSSVVTAPSWTDGSKQSISVTVNETGSGTLASGNVELQVFNSAGSAVMTQYWSAQSFSAGQSHTYAYTWSMPTSLPAGTYTVDIGVFNAAWSTDYYWNTDATVSVKK